jgi:hypothetical protein
MAVKVGRYHLFQRQQNTGTFWYYWFYDEEGKQVQKACGHGCEGKRDAAAILEDLLQTDLLKEKRKNELSRFSFYQFAEKMLLEGAQHSKRWREKGYILKPQTTAQHRRHLVNYLLPKYGKLALDKIRPANVEDYLLEQRFSNSSRNQILFTPILVMREAKREGLIEFIPSLNRSNVQEKDRTYCQAKN